ncbi:MAG: glycosyltransferase family 39 protein [Rhodospirillales bacterium]|nr:glycosyltransferase family 39 protein [Rhodospirillales bacterium]MCB9980451.1 glycosyltransferase family 39 protein [Rhodospirillales bacterium]
MNLPLKSLAPYACLGLLFLAAILFRPVLPIDETRYMSVAWEMFLQKQYAVLSMNFEPYHHKPPLLFWMINLFWNIFGVTRWAAMIPVFLSSAAVLYLTKVLIQKLAPQETDAAARTSWLMLGAFPFMIYATLIMFDMTVTALLLACCIVFLDIARTPRISRLLLAGLLIGAGVLTKGPVMYLYLLCPLCLYPLWKFPDFISNARFYKSLGIALLVSIIPVLLWLIPALSQTGNDFAFWLLWNQTAGRVSGNFSSAHVRPFYFYLTFLPVLILPWAFFPGVWKNIKTLPQTPSVFRFLLSATLPVFVIFSLIAGKQPHYMLPLLPFIVIGIALTLKTTSLPVIRTVSIMMIVLLSVGQGIAGYTVFKNYDLASYAAFYQEHAQQDWAYAGKYQGELGFIAKTQKTIESVAKEDLDTWFADHPGGFALIRYENPEEIQGYDLVFTQKYRGRSMGIIQKGPSQHD